MNHKGAGAADPQGRRTDPLKCQRDAEVAKMVLGSELKYSHQSFH